MYEQILIPVDGSDDAERGVAHGIDLAASVGATLHLLYVVEEGGNPWLSESMENQTERAKEYGQEILDEAAGRATDAGVEVVTEVQVSPRVHEKITDYAEDEGMDLIVMGSGYRGRFGNLLGSTAEKVLQSARVPVTTIRRRRDNG
jgi:nucleotide-binding universal stress UspA family protein